jgi:hypothetical protein
VTEYESLAHYSLAVGRATDLTDLQIRQLWEGQAELRDDLHALANRVEALTRARLTEPAEVAEAMVSPIYRWHECECGRTVRLGASDGLLYDKDGRHTCRLDAANVRRMAKEYE